MSIVLGNPMALSGKKKSKGLDFTYTGDYTEREDGVVELRSSGAIAFNTDAVIDIFLVGGGGRGGTGTASYARGGGGGSGYTRTVKKVSVIGSYEVSVGSGSTTQSGTGGTSSFGNYSVPGGNNGSNVFGSVSSGSGGDGGSGGGAGGPSGARGGSNGNNGGAADATYGKGQGFTTREFGEVTGKLYAAGGGGAVNGAGGEGGGGTGGNGETASTKGTAGEENTGSGGGGGSSYQDPGAGGSGIVCIRESTEVLDLVGTWKFNARIYPPAVSFDITSNYSIANSPPSYDGGYQRIYISGNKLMGTATIGAQTEFYNFSNHTQGSSFGYFRVDTKQSFTDEFLAWLASNATKQ